MVAKNGEVFVTLATRIPKDLHHELRVFSVEHGVSQMEFVCAALEEKLRLRGPRARGARGGGTARRHV